MEALGNGGYERRLVVALWRGGSRSIMGGGLRRRGRSYQAKKMWIKQRGMSRATTSMIFYDAHSMTKNVTFFTKTSQF
jgi:hypothetical protein